MIDRPSISRACLRASLALVLAVLAPAAEGWAANPGPWERVSYNELPRFGPVGVYDPVGHRMIYYGTSYEAPVGIETHIYSVLALTLGPNPSWIHLNAAGTPPPNEHHGTAIYDPIGHRMITFGLSGLWALSLGANPAWTQIAAGGDVPPDKFEHCAIYDPVAHRMIIHGGQGGDWRDVHALSLGGTPTWTKIEPAGPQIGHRMAIAVYDPIGHRMITDGGQMSWDGTAFQWSSETWALSLDETPTWSRLTPASGLPPEHLQHGGFYDPVRHSLVIFGGWIDPSGPPYSSNEVWELSLGANPQWTQRLPTGPLPSKRQQPLTVYDPVGDRMILFSGWNSGSQFDVPDDTWQLSLGAGSAWTQLAPDGSPPNVATGPSGVVDPTDGSLLVYGGVPLSTKPPTPLRALPLDGPPEWRELHPSGTIPPTRSKHSAVVDAANQRMIVFGGTRNSDGVTTNETWVLQLGASPAWTQLLPAGTPPDARHSHAAVYDPANQRMIVHGGETPGVGVRNDLWSLSLGGTPTWSPLVTTIPGAAPGFRAGHAAIYDAPRQRMVVFGGRNSSGTLVNSTHALTLGPEVGWSNLGAGGSIPARANTTAIYDPVAHRLVVFGGDDGAFGLKDVWTLRLWKPGFGWSQVPLTENLLYARASHVAVYDSAAGRMVAYGGTLLNYTQAPYAAADTWGLPLASCAPPLFVAQPESLALPYGATAVFSVNTTGVVAYQWKKDGVPLGNSGRISGVDTATLTITDFEASDVGSYSVEVDGACGNDDNESIAATLSYEPPVITCFGPPAPPPSGMAAWWAMEDGPGNTVPDVLHPVGNKNHASLTGAASLVAGKVGTALRCDGVNDGLHVPSTLSPRLAANSTGLSIDAWILPRSGSSPAAYRMILQKGLLKRGSTTVDGKTGLAPGYAFYLHGGGQLGFQMPDPNYNPVNFQPPMSAMTMDAWHHVAVTVDPLVPGGGKFYIDGVVVGTFTPPSGILGNLADLYIGRFTPQLGPATADSAFNGDIDEVEIFVTALDSASVRRIWSAGCTGKRRVQVLTNSMVEVRQQTASAEICSAIQNLSAVARNYTWTIAPLEPGSGCASSVPVTFTPSSGSITVGAGDRAELTSVASVSAGSLAAPFARCYRLTVTDLSDGGILTDDGVVQYTGQRITGRASCTPPVIGSASHPPAEDALAAGAPVGPGFVAGSGVATFTVDNDSTVGRAMDYTITTRDADSGGPSALLRLAGLPAGTPVSGSVFVPALGSAPVPVSVELDEYEPFLRDEIVLSADRDGNAITEELAVMHVQSGPDSGLAFVDVGPDPTAGGESGALRLRAIPNPFPRSTTLFFTLPRAGRVDVSVFDVRGRRVRRLVSEVLPAGEHRIQWNGRDDAERRIAPGLHFGRVRSAGQERILRLVLVD